MNVGAKWKNQTLFKTKKALREAFAKEPESVYFFKTATMFDGHGGFFGNEIPEGVSLVIVGPDPERDRKWYANVKKDSKGKLVVV